MSESATKEKAPLGTVSGQAIYDASNALRDGSWWDRCAAFEAALVEGGWTPPPGHPLRTADA